MFLLLINLLGYTTKRFMFRSRIVHRATSVEVKKVSWYLRKRSGSALSTRKIINKNKWTVITVITNKDNCLKGEHFLLYAYFRGKGRKFFRFKFIKGISLWKFDGVCKYTYWKKGIHKPIFKFLSANNLKKNRIFDNRIYLPFLKQ